MNLLKNLQDILGQGLAAGQGQARGAKGPQGLGGALQGGNLSGLMGPAALGALAGVLLTSKTARAAAGGALLAGGGAALWNMYKDRFSGSQVPSAPAPGADTSKAPVGSGTEERAARLIKALVFAAKSDGHIDAEEQRAIDAKLAELAVGDEARTLVLEALEAPLDPAALAEGVTHPAEALEVYAVSCAAVTPDHFMERSYLDALAKALNIPEDVQKQMESSL